MKRITLLLLLAIPLLSARDTTPMVHAATLSEAATVYALPDSVYSPIGWVPVHRTMTPCGMNNAFGCFDHVQMVIEVRDSIPASISKQTLYHEQFHLALFLQGITLGNIEDHVADVVSSYRVGEELSRK